MDPATLAAAITAFLVPFLSKAGEALVDQAQKKMPDEVNKIWDTIISKFNGKPAAQGSVGDLKSKADNRDNQEAFALQLQKILKDDPTFAAELEELFKTAQANVEIANTGGGGVATQGGTAAGAGGIAIGGSVNGNVILGSHNTVVGGQPNRADGSSPRRAADEDAKYREKGTLI